jgi:hypothetical protein
MMLAMIIPTGHFLEKEDRLAGRTVARKNTTATTFGGL